MTNAFGGKNEKSLYVPMSETEQEALARLVEAKSLEVVIHGWGVISDPKLTFGDKRVSIPISVRFDKIPAPVQVPSFLLELRTKEGVCLLREELSAMYGGLPLTISNGSEIQMVWDIAIKAMDPKLVKSLVPGALGLTSRSIDKETGRVTAQGNFKGLDPARRAMLDHIHAGEERLRRKG